MLGFNTAVPTVDFVGGCIFGRWSILNSAYILDYVIMNNLLSISDEMLLQEDMVDIMPAIEEANSISEDLDKKKKFEVMLVSPEARGQMKGRTEVII